MTEPTMMRLPTDSNKRDFFLLAMTQPISTAAITAAVTHQFVQYSVGRRFQTNR